jgi:hypothetical protein
MYNWGRCRDTPPPHCRQAVEAVGVRGIGITHVSNLEQFGMLAVITFPMFIKLRCVERSVFDPMVPDLRYLLSRAQGGTTLYLQEPAVLEDLYR